MGADTRQMFQERMRYLVRIAGTIDKLARAAGVSPRIIAKYMAGEADPSRERLVALARAAHVNVLWLATGEEPVAESPHGPFIEALRVRSPGYVSAIGAQHGEYVFIPMVQGKISAGGGLEPDNMIDMAVAFRKDWILRKGGPQNMSVIRVQGDSMSPTLQSRDLILVNHNIQTVAADGGIYAIALGNEIMIKRVLVKPDGDLLVVSDNKAYPEIKAEASSVVINGKVVWFARDLEQN